VKTEGSRAVLAGRYVLGMELGRGGVGIAWTATDTVLDRRVVVKLVRPEVSQQPGFAERLSSEVRGVARISHPALTRLLDVGVDGGIAYLVREHVEGENLRDLLARRGPLPPQEAARLVASVLDALAEIHRSGALHLDLTPENVIVAPDGSVRVCDAGIRAAVEAATRQESESSTTISAGHPLGAAIGAVPDERTDVRASGVLLFELLTGAPPSGDPSPRARRRQIPRELEAVVVRTLSSESTEPLQSAARLASELRTIAGEEPEGWPVAWPAAGGGEPSSRLGRRAWPRPSVFRTWLVVPLLVAVVAATMVAVGLSLGRLEIGGPVGVRLKPTESSPSASVPVPLSFASVRAYDPLGDGVENSSNAPLASDGDQETVWKSENYYDGRLNKAGVGLLFDLGAPQTVTGFRLSTPWPGFSFRVAVGNDPASLTAAGGITYTAASDMEEAIPHETGRYVLLWFTSVVRTDDGNRIDVAEFGVLGS